MEHQRKPSMITKFGKLTLPLALAALVTPILRAQDSSSIASPKEEDLAKRTIERRAVEALIWGMPAVNFDLMYQAMIRDAKAGAGSNKIVYWSKLSDWKNQTLTPNPDAIYLMPFFNTKDVGPVVLEIPPADETRGSMERAVLWHDSEEQPSVEQVAPSSRSSGHAHCAFGKPPRP